MSDGIVGHCPEACGDTIVKYVGRSPSATSFSALQALVSSSPDSALGGKRAALVEEADSYFERVAG